jgi:hypothetical protein
LGEGRIQTALPDGVNFEVPRDYARYCDGQRARVGVLEPFENGVHVA